MLIHRLPGNPTFKEFLQSNSLLLKLKIFQNYKIELILLIILAYISIGFFVFFASSNIHLAYNDAMSHLNIARRVFDNIQPGLAQLGSVWLPLPHLLMLISVWDYFLWQTGFSGAIISMASFIATSFFTFKIVKAMTGSNFGSFVSALIVAFNLNFLYLQTTALTEPLFMAFFTISMYFFYKWIRNMKPLFLITTAFFTFLMTLTRYDAWFVFVSLTLGIFVITFFKKNFVKAEGMTILFITLGGLGIILWILYNFVIFNDPFYFALGEFSAKTQQDQLLRAGELSTKGDIFFSLKTYYFAAVNNIGIIILALSMLGLVYYFLKEKSIFAFVFAFVLLSIVIFNILALFFGFSVIFLPETTGDSWFNVRYGLIILPVVAIFIGYLLGTKGTIFYILLPALLVFQTGTFFGTGYAVTIIDGTVGSSQKNVGPTARELRKIYSYEKGYILGSAASHDAIFFASGIPLEQFIHEGVSKMWTPAVSNPEKYAEYIIMRTNDNLDSVCRKVCRIPDLNSKYNIVFKGEFADIYKRKN